MRKTMILLGFLALAPFAKGQLLLEALDKPALASANCQPELDGTWIIVNMNSGNYYSGIQWLQCKYYDEAFGLGQFITLKGWTWARFLPDTNVLYVPTSEKININDKTIVTNYSSGLNFAHSICGILDVEPEPGAWFRPSKGCPIVGFADYFNGPIHSLPKTER